MNVVQFFLTTDISTWEPSSSTSTAAWSTSAST